MSRIPLNTIPEGIISAKSCGTIIYRLEKTGSQIDIEFLIIKNAHGKHWDYPKGNMEAGESEEQTALREVYEEVGLHITLIPPFREEMHFIGRKGTLYRTVVYFLAQVESEEFNIDPNEILEAHWMSYNDAIAKVTYPNSRDILNKANTFIRKTLE